MEAGNRRAEAAQGPRASNSQLVAREKKSGSVAFGAYRASGSRTMSGGLGSAPRDRSSAAVVSDFA